MKVLRLHRWEVTPGEAIQIQERLRRRIKLTSLSGKPSFIAGADVSFSATSAKGVVVVMTYPSLRIIEEIKKELPLEFPYIPTLLTFREGPVLLECFLSLREKVDLIMFDGQGIAHPRGMGLATHLGILLSTPAIGCAKSRLTGNYKEPGIKKGSYSYIKDRSGRIIGAALRTRDKVKPVFVSPGYRINLRDSIDIVLRCTGKFRIPEPLRYAHTLGKNGREK